MLDDDQVKTVSKAEQLANRFETLIENGELGEGQYLGTKVDLAETHGVAAGTLNEALRLLQSRGYLNMRPGPKGGAFVAESSQRVRLRHTILDLEETVSSQTFNEYTAVRDELEGLVAEEAAKACTPADAEHLERLMADITTVAPGREQLLAIWALHRRIARIGANDYAASIYVATLDAIEKQTTVRAVDDSVPSGVSGDTVEVHRQLVDAVIARDPVAAREAAHAHTPVGHARE